MTAPAHVLVFRPIVDRLRARGHEVELTARDYSQTVELMHMHGLHATVFGRHGGAGRMEKAFALASRTRAMRPFGRGRGFELALAHGSHDPARVVVVFRPPPDVALYHRKSNPLFPQVLDRLGGEPGVHAIVIPRTEAQREYVRNLNLPSVIVPDGAVDAQSLIALADLVISAGGTMNREAVALGTPVYTTYGGRLGGVDEALIREGRLRPLTDPRAIELNKR